jgi:hypothetical protein
LRSAIEQLGTEQYVYISLQIETNVSNADLAAYADREGFNWLFAVVTPELLKVLVDQFGRSITIPPSTPHFTISPSGMVSALSTGRHTTEDFVAELSAIQSAG